MNNKNNRHGAYGDDKLSSYREFRAQTKKKRRRRTFQRFMLILLIAVLLGGTAFLAVRLTGLLEPSQEESSSVASGDSASQTADSSGDTQAQLPYTEGSVERTINVFDPITPDRRMYALPENGQVDLSYFDDATFVGDSITTGWHSYRTMTNLPNAHVVAEIGARPPVDGVLWRRGNTTETYDPMQAIADTVPKKVYIMFGTNTLVSQGDYVEDKLIEDYGKFIDDLGARIPGCEIYIQSILIPTAEATAEKPGLSPERINRVNDRLAVLAFEKGCHYLDLQSFLCKQGVLNWDIAQPDGIHIKPEAYNAWLDYLSKHTAYNATSTYIGGSPVPQTEEAQ